MLLLYTFLIPSVLILGTLFAAMLAGLFLELCKRLGTDQE